MALPPRVLSVCAGIGGLDLGVHRATGARTVCYVERDSFAAAVLVARMETEDLARAPVWDSLETFDCRPWRGYVDGLIGGTPCTNTSVAGDRTGLDGEESKLFWEYVRVLGELGCAWFLWENVGGARKELPRVFEAFARLGYVGAAVFVRASDVGAPQKRERCFVLGRLAHGHGHGRESERKPEAPGLERALRDVADGQGGAGGGMGDAGGRVVQLRREPREPRELRCEERGAGREGNETSRSESRTASPPLPWPPRPDDVEGWRIVIAEHPHLAPSEPRAAIELDDEEDATLSGLRGVVDESADWLDSLWADRLRALGNGVVPAQAEAAVRFLARHVAEL